MKDRVREALFNLIGDAVVDAYAVDLFAGSGAIGLEAVSRGSRGAVFIEQHFPTAALLRQSAATLGVADICDVRAADVFLWAKTLWARAATADQPAESTSEKLVFGSLPRDCPWIVFCSPPYAFYVDRRGEVLALIEAMWSAAPAGSVVVVEADEHFDLAALPSATDWQIRTYPPATIALYWKRSG
jgi:16S rRNA (guanine966-N2)-methyltransferase